MNVKGKSSSKAEAFFSFTNLKKTTIAGSGLLLPFFEKHLPAFALTVPMLKITFDAKTTIFSGSVDMVVAIVVATVKGKRQLVIEAEKEKEGEVEASAEEAGGGGGFSQQSSLSQGNEPREGILGASFCVLHLSKSHDSDHVKVKDRAIVQRNDDPKFTQFLRRIKLKEFRQLITGLPKSSMGFLTEKESDMESHETLDDHVEAMKANEPFKSLGSGGWEEGKGVVNLKVSSNTTELYDEARLPTGADISQRFQGSMNYILTSTSLEYLSDLYQEIKRKKSVQVAGMTVLAMSPVFTVDTSGFLPIYFFGGIDEVKDSEVPGAVVRDHMGAVFVFPVQGYEQNKLSATVYDDQWEVRESFVRLSRGNVEKIELLKERGFHEIKAEDGTEKEDESVMGRHQLARIGDALDDENSTFRVGQADSTTATTTPVAMASSVPSLWSSSVDGQHTKKQKTTSVGKKA